MARSSRHTPAGRGAARLRLLERDLHDGAQADVVGVAMKLGLAQEKLAQAEQDSPPEVAHARRLVEAAHAGAKTALRELRISPAACVLRGWSRGWTRR